MLFQRALLVVALCTTIVNSATLTGDKGRNSIGSWDALLARCCKEECVVVGSI